VEQEPAMRLRVSLLLSFVLAAGLWGALAAASAAAQAPANDTRANATVISSLPFSTTLDTTQATTDADDTEVGAACGYSGPAAATVWYAYTPPTDQLVAIDTSGSSYSAGIGVVTGTPGSFSSVACIAGTGAFSAIAGQTYYFDVADISGGTGGTLSLSVTAPTPPAVQMSVDRRGHFDPHTGTATVTGTVTCTAGATADISLNLTQKVGRSATISGVGFTGITCDGTTQPWFASVRPSSGKFKRGRARVIADAFVCNLAGCATAHVERTIKLRKLRRPNVIPPRSHPFGLNYNQWSAVWWQQALAVSQNPGAPFESGSVNCSRLGTRHVAFLAGLTNAQTTNTVERSCELRTGQAILFPLINVECSTIEPNPLGGPDPRSNADLRQCAQDVANLFTNLTATVDGAPIAHLTAFRFSSPVFTFTAAPHNYFNIPAGEPARAVSDGYWIMLTPPAPGIHTVSFGGAAPSLGFSTLATYTITVEHRHHHSPEHRSQPTG
jgi:Family of unknown function (DUF6299)